jgi:N-acetylated-alpha-linked acidic dipeptidase
VKRMAAILVGPALGAAVAVLLLLAWRPSGTSPISGFTAAHLGRQHAVERRFLGLPDADVIRDAHRLLTERPHVAGSDRDHELAEWTRDRWREFGLEDVSIVEHDALLPYPDEVSVEMTAPRRWRASMREDPIPGDPATAATDVGTPYLAYSASGEVEAEVVYAGSGNPADYDWLAAHGVDVRGRIALVRYSVPYSYRGFKALTAQRRGAAAVLIYSDPADDGSGKGAVYPDGPWGNDSHIQRGAIAYDFMVPGDPLTPGWASVPGAPRIPADEALSLPTIMAAPLSARDARVILEALDGPEAPQTWQGGLGFPYHVGAGAARLHLRIRHDDRVRPIWTVVGRLHGAERPEEVIIVGNHRDAWVYGGVDPSSGSAALMELARTLGALAREGDRPRRTVLFASWDAEEFTLTSSTEWGEQNADWLGAQAVAYLNVDSAASGPDFGASAVPSLNTLTVETARAVRDPATGRSIASEWRARASRERGRDLSYADLVRNRLGSGSDYTVFLNFLGVPVADLSFDGPYGVYHSIYDDHQWVARIGDPGFRYHVALVELWGLMTLRLANADVLPLNPEPYAAAIRAYLDELDRQWLSSSPDAERRGGERSPELTPAREAADRLVVTASRRAARDVEILREGDPAKLQALNERLMKFERAFLDTAGIPGRPWYRHQIYAPRFTYAAEVLPGVTEAVEAGDPVAVRREAERLAAALSRAADTLDPVRRP